MKTLKIGDIEVRLPIIQGGMGIGVSLSGLAGAVANEGGIGTISAVMPGFREPDIYKNYLEANIRGLRKEIQRAKTLTKGILAVNIMVALTNYEDMVRTAIEEGADIIISGAGLPLGLPKYLNGSSRTKLIPIISTERSADLIIRKWQKSYNYIPDALILESPFSGGHQGVKADEINQDTFTLDQQLPKVLSVVDKYRQMYGKPIPVIVAGGIYTGADIKKYMDMGASGAQLGSRFITTDECDADIEFKNQYLNCNNKNDIIVIKSPVGLPLRIIKNKFITEVLKGKRKPKACPYKCLHTCDYKEVSFCISMALMNAQRGNINEGILCSGTNGYRNDEIIPVSELISRIKSEYNFNPLKKLKLQPAVI
ncbi:MAG: nitronate monooxygenase [Brevinematales bacterium]|nr:nitronate monooxygenase [Brevinematales bacterium]